MALRVETRVDSGCPAGPRPLTFREGAMVQGGLSRFLVLYHLWASVPQAGRRRFSLGQDFLGM